MATAFWGRCALPTLGVFLLALAHDTHAGAPQLRTSAPGWYRVMLGDFEVTVLSDGTFDLTVTKLLTNTTPEKVEAALKRDFLTEPVAASVNGFLINTGSKLVLIDTGAGELFGPTVGKLVDNLKASGYRPEDVDAVSITHMHGDHIGGLTVGGKRVYPNATVHVDRHDTDFWLSEEQMNAVPEERRAPFKGAIATFTPYIEAGRLKPFEGDTELVPGIHAVAAHGHTPGHTIYRVQSQGQELVLWGDLMHVAAVQFAEPTVTIAFDSDSAAAMAERQKQFADAAKRGVWVGAAHLSFPGFGHLRAEGAGYVFVPAPYTVIR